MKLRKRINFCERMEKMNFFFLANDMNDFDLLLVTGEFRL